MLPYELKMYLLLAVLSIIGLTARYIFLPVFVSIAFVGFALAYVGWVPKLAVATEWFRLPPSGFGFCSSFFQVVFAMYTARGFILVVA